MMSSRNRGQQRFIIEDEPDLERDQDMTDEWKRSLFKYTLVVLSLKASIHNCVWDINIELNKFILILLLKPIKF
jgi:hypothetical protein